MARKQQLNFGPFKVQEIVLPKGEQPKRNIPVCKMDCYECRQRAQRLNNDMDFDDLVEKFLKDNKFKRFSNGGYSTIYSHPNHPSRVLKVFFDDDGYLTYLQWVAKNQNCAFAPRIYNIMHITGDSKTYKGDEAWAVSMERLTPLKGGNRKYVNMFESVLTMDSKAFELLGVKHNPFADLAAFLEKNRFDANDIHDGNIMMRGNQPVLIDPVAY